MDSAGIPTHALRTTPAIKVMACAARRVGRVVRTCGVSTVGWSSRRYLAQVCFVQLDLRRLRHPEHPGGEVLHGVRVAARVRVPQLRVRQPSEREVLLRVRYATWHPF